MSDFSKEKKKWEEKVKNAEARFSPRKKRFSTLSDVESPALCTPEELKNFNYVNDLGFPGEYPFTRGVQPNLYRGKLWTMRQFAGYASAAETNKRFKFLLKQGQTGLSTAFDMPTLMGYDADSSFAQGEVGKCGVSISSLEDMEELYAGIPLSDVTTSMTINGPAIVLMAMYFAVAEKQGVSRAQVKGTLQNDILKEYIAQKEWLFPVQAGVKLVVDTIEYCTKEYPAWNTVSISGYHIREAGATAAQELAFTLADGLEYVKLSVARGLDVDSFAPRLSFFFDVHLDFFEEIAKLRAARRMWARFMRERFKAQNPRSWMLRTHAQTAGCSLTAQQPHNNIVRVAIQALAGVLGGVNSLHTNSMDETLSLPTDEAVMTALRTQQIIAEEMEVANTVDPLGGAYFVEHLTNTIEKEAMMLIQKIDEMGGMCEAVEQGYPQAEIANSAYHYQQQLERREKVVVGVNKYVADEEQRTIRTLQIDQAVEKNQINKLKSLRLKRSQSQVSQALSAIHTAATNDQNLCEPVVEAVKSLATLQEVCDTLRKIYGDWQEVDNF